MPTSGADVDDSPDDPETFAARDIAGTCRKGRS